MLEKYCVVDIEYCTVELRVEAYVEYEEYTEQGCASKDGDPGNPPFDSIAVDMLSIIAVYVIDSEWDISPMLNAATIRELHDRCIEEIEAGNMEDR